jgi:D-alanyl-D-alanine carboxypeptidase (penicillin-binding protein 5/6)
MSILLIVEAIEAGEFSLDDVVTASANASGMGEAQIFLREGERMSVRDLLKSAVVSSANDATLALAEKCSGTESAFVTRMNERAKLLGMTNTYFTNCTGLPKDQSHLTTARDIAVMSRELMAHGMITQYTTIWMDTVRDGTFGLNNTNKLIRFYDGATGLKTGYTSRSMYCVSATATRDNVSYIALVLADETSDKRFESAKTLLNYAFANYTVIPVTPDEAIKPIKVDLGKTPYVQPIIEGGDSLLISKSDAKSITKELTLPARLPAPIKQGEKLGTLTIKSGDKTLGEYPITAANQVKRKTWADIFKAFLTQLFTNPEK